MQHPAVGGSGGKATKGVMTGFLVRRLTLAAPPRSAPRPHPPVRGLVLCGVGQKRREASEARLRRREIEEDAVPSEAARGFCRRCAATHRLERTPRAEAEAHALMRRIRETGRIDFDSDQPPDPRFAVERMYEPGGGKMLGVLVAVPPSRSSSAGARGGGADEKEEEEEEIVVLKAFSGQLYGEWTVPGWSPPLCGLTHTHPHYIREHARIKAVVDAAGAKAKVVAELEEEVKREEDAWDGRIDALAARLREERQARRATRREKRADERAEVEVATIAAAATAQPIMPELEGETQLSMAALELETKLAEESRAGKRELARLRRERAEAVAEPTAALVAARDEMNRLRTRHRSMSHVLLGEIFESYKLPNFRRVKEEDVTASDECDAQDGDGKKEVDNFSGWSSGATLREAFVSEDGKDGEDVKLPCGCGDCCAPKLLAECARRGLAPVSIAEVWMGVPTRKEGDRTEGSFYGACRGRCRPILGHMLCGCRELVSEERKNKLIELPSR